MLRYFFRLDPSRNTPTSQSASVAETALIGSATQHPIASLFIVVVIWPSCSKTSQKPSFWEFSWHYRLGEEPPNVGGITHPIWLETSLGSLGTGGYGFAMSQQDLDRKSTRNGCLNGHPYHKVRPISLIILKLKIWYASLVKYNMSNMSFYKCVGARNITSFHQTWLNLRSFNYIYRP